MRSLLSLLYLGIFWTAGTRASDPNLPFMEYLDKDHLVCLKWGFDNLQGDITFKLVVNTTGWVGIGFSPNGGMQGADIVMGGQGSSGSYFNDYYATGNSMPLVDKQQSYTLLSMDESNNQTLMTFKRPIQSCDDQDFHISNQAIKVIYAYGPTDVISYHGSLRGAKEVNLLNYMPRATISGNKYISARVDNITIPESHTYYHCKVMKLPKLYKKHHIYLIEPVIEHLDIIHHMLLYRCPFFVTEPYDGPCYSGDVGDACFDIVASWGVGGGVFALPEDVGFPIGGEENEVFYRLEIHYNNPYGYTDRIDSSGLNMHYTELLRQHDAAILSTGMLFFENMEYKIPPRASRFHTYGVCNTSLFSQLINSSPDLHVFAVLLHTHLAGREIEVVHFRNGEQADLLAWDKNYNFELQQTTSLGKIRTIKPGDELLVECTYSTSDRTKVTKMGLGTTDEMCLAFLFYYPAIKITTCISHPNTLHPSLSTSNQLFEESRTLTEEEILEYERLLKTVPQIHLVSDDDSNHTFYANGIVRETKTTPTVTCKNTNSSNRLSASWITETAGAMLLLLLIANM
ncbi:DBH-like monooxygenase protein 2 homolog [Cheilinus undulatus]|uniref:DBH-like monooxygenase protein 2 homolog n=1 Tax=Cheilinus undulatus TaxID=241271 RepID=UPI001BD41479|nr:DBH-like monooxygenase protein 2 homolog [Cheilinus undulatus]